MNAPTWLRVRVAVGRFCRVAAGADTASLVPPSSLRPQLPLIDRRWCLIAERLMRSFLIIKRKVACQLRSCLARASIVVAIDLLLLDTTPQALGEDVVQRPALPIHTDLHTGHQQQLGVLRAGKVTA